MVNNVNEIIKIYNDIILNTQDNATNNKSRALGGMLRSDKGKLVERLALELVEYSWIKLLKQNPKRLKVDKKKIPIQMNNDYLDRDFEDKDINIYLRNNKQKIKYNFGTDLHIYIDNILVLPIECKAYTENAMLKRIVFDAMLMRKSKGIETYILFQLESQLGGDYSSLNSVSFGSDSSHTIMSFLPIDTNIRIITLLKGERKVDQPIHLKKYFKPLTEDSVNKALERISKLLTKYAK
jgi:hypothetical protein